MLIVLGILCGYLTGLGYVVMKHLIERNDTYEKRN